VYILGEFREVLEIFGAYFCSRHWRLCYNLSADVSDSKLVESEILEDFKVSVLGWIYIIVNSELLFAQDFHDIAFDIQDALIWFNFNVLGTIENKHMSIISEIPKMSIPNKLLIGTSMVLITLTTDGVN
jgi:hypothetical protein